MYCFDKDRAHVATGGDGGMKMEERTNGRGTGTIAEAREKKR